MGGGIPDLRACNLESNGTAEGLLERRDVPVRGPQLEFGVPARPQPREIRIVLLMQIDAGDHLGVAAIEPFGEADHRREHLDDFPRCAAEIAIALVRLLRRRLAVIAGDERDHLDLLGREAAEVAVLYQIVRVTVVPLVADVDADVVEQGAELQPFALPIAEPVDAPRLVEDVQRKLGDLPGVLGPVPAALAQLDDAAAPHVRVAVDLADPRAVALDVVEDETFAEGEVAEREIPRPEAPEYRVEEDDPGHREVGAPRIHPRQLQPLGEARLEEPIPKAAKRLQRDPLIPELPRGTATGGEYHRAEAEDRSGRADDPVEAAPGHLVEVRPHLARHEPGQAPVIVPGERIGPDEAFGKADDARLEALSQLEPPGGPERDLDAAAANVDHDRGGGADVDAVGGGQVDQPGLFRAGNQLDPDARFAGDIRDEVAAVVCLTGGACRRREDLVDLVRLGQALEPAERVQRRRPRRGGQAAPIEAAGSEPHHVFLAIHDLEREVRTDLDHDHVDGVGADVYGGDAHGRGGVAGTACALTRPYLTGAAAGRPATVQPVG